jgi:hypothetical protein
MESDLRRWMRLVTESVRDINGVRTWVDPSARQLLALSRTMALRGTVMNGQMYVWNALDDTHYGLRGEVIGYETDIEDYAGDDDFVIATLDHNEMQDWRTGNEIEISPGIFLSGNTKALSHPVLQSLIKRAP